MDGHSNGSTASLEDCTAAFRQAPQDLLLARASIDGDVAQFRLGGDVYCSIASPRLARQVFLGDPLLLRKGNLYDIPRRMLGDGMFTDEWEEWADHRNLRDANFSKSKIAAHTATIVAALTRWIGTWEEAARAGAVVDPFRGGRRFAFEVVLRTLFNIPASADTAALFEAAEQVVGVEHVTVDRLLAQLPRSSRVFELFASSAQSVALERMDALAYEFIDQRRAAREQPDDLLAAAMACQHFRQQSPSRARRYLRDLLVTMVVAGSMSTGDAIGWTVCLLAQHPAVADRLRRELGEPAGNQLSAAASLPLLTAIIDETLRLYPPLWFIGRVPAEETRFGDVVVPAGTRVLCSPYVLHRRPAWWRDPARFIPERFLQANSGGRAAFLPFGQGPRACVGQVMARLEMSTALSVLVRRFRFNLATGCMPQPGGAYTLHPRHPVGLFLEPWCRHVAR